MKKFIAILLVNILVLSLTFTVYAHDFPSNLDDWTKEDWKKFAEYCEEHDDHHRDRDKGKEGWYNGRYYYYNGDNYYYVADDGCTYTCDKPPYFDNNNNCSNNCPPNNNYYNYNYNGYNFYGGILDVYDGSTEDQATVLARIINIYAHGVASQTAQAAVGWAVMNSVDASGRGANVCTVAGNFNYDYNGNVTDDFGRSLLPLARDILFRWKAGRAGCGSNGRVLPGGYFYVTSTGGAVAFGSNPNEARAVTSFGYASPYGN